LIFDGSGRYQYEVAPACGGIRSLTAIFVLSLCCGFVFFKSIWKRILLVVSAVPLAVAGNVLRLLAIIFAAELAGQEAGAKVHDSSIFSILPYLPAFIGFWILTYWLGEERKGGDLMFEERKSVYVLSVVAAFLMVGAGVLLGYLQVNQRLSESPVKVVSDQCRAWIQATGIKGFYFWDKQDLFAGEGIGLFINFVSVEKRSTIRYLRIRLYGGGFIVRVMVLR
jgi:exosortase/archaeosortase family protein